MSSLGDFIGQREQAYRVWLWRQSAPAESRLFRFLRAFLRVTLVYVREFFRDNLLLRASALTFTVVLSIVPVLALSTAVLKGLGAGDQLRQAAYQFIDAFEVPEPPAAQPEAGSAVIPGEPSRLPPTTASHLKRAVDTIFNYVNRTSFATLGVLGVVGLFITVIMVLAAIEDAMNAIWQAAAGRPLGRRILDYLALLLLLPLAINIGVAAMAALQSPAFLSAVERIFIVAWAGPLLLQLVTFGFLVAVLTTLYRFLPNTRVEFQPALIGGVVGGLGWLLLQTLYVKLQLGVARYNAIYGSFATLPLFLLWIYFIWLVFLSGAEVSYAAWVWQRYGQEPQKNSASSRLALAFDLLAAIYGEFKARRTAELSALSSRLGYDSMVINAVLDDLLTADLLREGQKAGSFLPAAPAADIRLTEVVDALWGSVQKRSPGSGLTEEALHGARERLQQRTLQDLLQNGSPDTRQT